MKSISLTRRPFDIRVELGPVLIDLGELYLILEIEKTISVLIITSYQGKNAPRLMPLVKFRLVTMSFTTDLLSSLSASFRD